MTTLPSNLDPPDFDRMLSSSVKETIQHKLDQHIDDLNETLDWALRAADSSIPLHSASNKFDRELKRAIARETLRQAYMQGRMDSVHSDRYLISLLSGEIE